MSGFLAGSCIYEPFIEAASIAVIIPCRMLLYYDYAGRIRIEDIIAACDFILSKDSRNKILSV
jgi:hypothetical protein